MAVSNHDYKYGRPMLFGINERGRGKYAFIDLHSANRNNQPPLTLITGKPGSGKTYAMLWLLSLSAIQGAAVVGIDWKGDLLKIAEANHILGINSKVFSVDPKDPKNQGILDPFVIFDSDDPDESSSDILTAVHSLCHSLLPGALADISIGGWVDTTIKDTIAEPRSERSMTTFIDKLLKVARDSGREKLTDFALNLESRLNGGAGKILCAESDRKPARYFEFETGITVIDLSELHELPKNIQELNDPSKAVGQAILTMINLLIRQSMLRMEKNIRKVLVIDEAWSILANPSGMALVESTTRLGRSFNLSVVLTTQNYSEIFNDTNNLNTSFASTHFAFNNSEEDAAIGAKAMGLKGDNAEQAIDAITKLDQGECFMQDIRKRRGLVYVEIWLPDLPEIFDSNPYATKD